MMVGGTSASVFSVSRCQPREQCVYADLRVPGLRAELYTRHGIAGHAINTTSVHPSWHSTGITKAAEPQLAKYGIIPDPPTNVTDLIVEQVLAGRSGRIHVPKDQIRYENVRSWPLWVQDVLAGYPWKRGDRESGFRFGDEDGLGQEGIKVD
jgi:all-trans-retinol dehydrogenase (NAD+)